jgi:hypothetical protein
VPPVWYHGNLVLRQTKTNLQQANEALAPSLLVAAVNWLAYKRIVDSLTLSAMGIADYINRSELTADSGLYVGKIIGNMTLDVVKCLP